MAIKYDELMKVYQESTKAVTTSPENWKSFLRAACRNYKLRFDEQLLVFAQKPDALAVLPYKDWRKFGRKVKRGTKGIAVFSQNIERHVPEYYYDISDTESIESTIPVPIWEMSPEYETSVRTALEGFIQNPNKEESLEQTVFHAAKDAVQVQIDKYITDFLDNRANSSLSSFDSSIASQMYQKILTNSVSYTICARLHLEEHIPIADADFTEISAFDSVSTVNFITHPLTTIVQPILSAVAMSIKMYDLKNRTFDSFKETEYNNGEAKNEGSSYDERKREENREYGDSVQKSGQVSASRREISGSSRPAIRTLRTDEKEIPTGKSSGHLRQPVHELQTGTNSLRDRTESIGNAKTAHQGDEGTGKRDRAAESGRLDGIRTEGKQHSSESKGNRTNGSDLRLSSESQKQNTEQDAELKSSAFSFSQELIDEVLTKGSGFSQGKFRIYQHFQESYSSTENAKFLEKEYGIGGVYPIIQEPKISEDYNAKGIELRYIPTNKKLKLTWKQVESRIAELIRLDRYLNPKEAENYPTWLEKQQRKQTTKQQEDVDKSAQQILTQVEYVYHLGDKVYLGANEYEIVSVTDKDVTLSDTKFPLFTKDMSLEEFEKKVKENPYNDHLQILSQPTEEAENLPVYDREPEILYDVFSALNLKDFDISFDDNGLVVSDSAGNSWHNEEIYKHLLENVLTLREDESIDEFDGKLLTDFKELATHHGVPFKKHREAKWIIEFNETSDNIPNYKGKNVDAALLKEIINLDNTEKKKDEYVKFYFDYVIDGKVTEHFRIDIGDGAEINRENYEHIAKKGQFELDWNTLFKKTENLWEIYQQYQKKNNESILLMQVGDFFEIMGENAKLVSEKLDLSLTTRSIDTAVHIPLVGIPKHSLEKSVEKLEQYGYEVSVVTAYGVSIMEGELHSALETEQTQPKAEKMVMPVGSIFNPINAQVKYEETDKATKTSLSTEKINFDLAAHPLEDASKKVRFQQNIDALHILKECEFENRLATPDEQLILSKYVGWGGLSEAFDENNSSWADEFIELYTMLSPEEYAAARESTLTAFYTPPEIISAVYKAIENMGFRTGNILEPSCGIGNFLGMLPKSMQSSKLYGVELDPVSATIAKQLYQKANIAAQGYEKTNLPDSFFDIAIGNVPFGEFGVVDKRYDKYHFLIHDYFFAKTLDKLRPGGIMAFLTSKGTMDKANPSVRKYIAQRADLLGAIRLPNNAFKGNAGTEVVSDILFFQKRDRAQEVELDWLYLDTDKNGRKMNSYFVQHPDMVLGEWKTVSGRFGDEDTVVPYENGNIVQLLDKAISNIHGSIEEYEHEEVEQDTVAIPADANVRNFSYTVHDDKIYFRENSIMSPLKVPDSAIPRIKGMIAIRDTVRKLIELQTEDFPQKAIDAEQKKLGEIYDRFTAKYGWLNDKANIKAFEADDASALLSALEKIDSESGQVLGKSDIFTKRTIRPHVPVTHVDTSVEALELSMGEKAGVDMDYMCHLTGKSEEEVYSDLQGIIFLNPVQSDFQPKYLSADEYLSGNIRKKLSQAQQAKAEYGNQYEINVQALSKVQPEELTAGDIYVRLGSTWIPATYIQQFVYELLGTPSYCRYDIKVNFCEQTGQWNISNKSMDVGNIKAYTTYGTNRINAYKIIEETLNLHDVQINDTVYDVDGKAKSVPNPKETAIALAKQELIEQKFSEWIWNDADRRIQLCKIYNEKFNSIRPREYDGSHLNFVGMNAEISLEKHQRNAVARVLYGGNTLLAHCVGAGKTFEMVAAAMESKRLGLCHKSLFVVPNHLTEQWAAEFMQLYPTANILVAKKKDFETKNRKRFCSRIATGNYDAVIIGHSQFEKIPMSVTRQREMLTKEINELVESIAELRYSSGNAFSVKQMESMKKRLNLRLEKLNEQGDKDTVVTFEELGVDRLFVDESHYYKNLFFYTKMRNVGGIAQTEAKKSSDLFMKCQYLDEITGGKGITFATGTPISNSMVELYANQRYLQYDALKQSRLLNFDAWASTFGETVTAMELTPEGSGYRKKKRFSKFYNLPELMALFKEVADIQTSEMLHLPVPKANYHTVVTEPSQLQKDMVEELGQRAELVRNGAVPPNKDNMLLITNDGRKLALDQRLINSELPDFEGSKVNACVDNVYKIWNDTKDKKLTQLIFCDLSTPKENGEFSVYDDIRNKLVEKGVPAEEVKFIHEAKTETAKDVLFNKVRRGKVRILMGSTQKMGAGTNIQDRLIALHDLDCPWRPSDLEQRSGRIIRKGNQNSEVDIYRYVTKETFDSYLYQTVENKQKFISQIMSGKSPVRSAEDVDAAALSYAEIKMLTTGNPLIKEKMDLDIQVQKLRLLKANYLNEKYTLEDKILKFYPQTISQLRGELKGLEQDISIVKEHPKTVGDNFSGMTVLGVFYSKKSDAGDALLAACHSVDCKESVSIGNYRGFDLQIQFLMFEQLFNLNVVGTLSHSVEMGGDAIGNITRLDNLIDGLEKEYTATELLLKNRLEQFETAKVDVKKPFEQEEELTVAAKKLERLNVLLNIDEKTKKETDPRSTQHKKNKEYLTR